MSIRELLQGKPVAAIGVIVVLILLSAWITMRQQKSSSAIYYDMQSGKLFAYGGDALPPIPAPSGGDGVMAHVFACGDCGNKETRFIGYLERYTEAGKAQVKRTAELIAASSKDNPPAPQPPPEREVSVVEDGKPTQWLNATHPDAMRVMNQFRQRCTNPGQIVRCSDL